MQLEKEELYRLTEGWLKGALTDAEMIRLNNWYKQHGEELQLHVEDDTEESLRLRMLARLQEHAGLQPARNTVIKRIWKYAAAAIILITAGVLYMRYSPVKKTEAVVLAPQDILPGKNKAVLTIEGGKQIILDSVNNISAILKDRNISASDGELQYNTSSGAAYETTFHTLSTPAGGQYKLVLPDGSLVWLNAVSVIKFPTAFTGKERTVELTGEAYFEIKKNKQKPFKVITAGDTIQVLGTDFNVNAYADEPSYTTTLLSGSVKINNKVLLPGQAYKDGIVANVNTQQAVAWKNGMFNFDKLELNEAMRQIARWYNVQIVYEGGTIPDKRFAGKIGRDLNLSQIIIGLKALGVNCRIEGRQLFVTSK